jgi:hypothetical protein
MNIGAPMTGKRKQSRKISGIGIELVAFAIKDSGLAVWHYGALQRTPRCVIGL